MEITLLYEAINLFSDSNILPLTNVINTMLFKLRSALSK